MTLLSNNMNTNEYNEFRNIMISATTIRISVQYFEKLFMLYQYNLHYTFNFDLKSKVQNNKRHLKVSKCLTAKFSTGLVLFLHV